MGKISKGETTENAGDVAKFRFPAVCLIDPLPAELNLHIIPELSYQSNRKPRIATDNHREPLMSSQEAKMEQNEPEEETIELG